jgi:hypothetical protein
MADYASTSVTIRYGEVSDYSDKMVNRGLTYDSTTATAVYGPQRIVATTGGVTIDLAGFTAIESITIQNLSSTVDVEVRQQSLAPVTGTTANKLLLNAGRVMVLPSATVANDIVLITQASSAECEVIIYGTINS